MDNTVKPGDVIQINPNAGGDPCWHGVFMLVEEIHDWGILAVTFAPIAGKKNDPPGRFYLKLVNERGIPQHGRIGYCPFVPGDIASKLWPDISKDDEGWL